MTSSESGRERSTQRFRRQARPRSAEPRSCCNSSCILPTAARPTSQLVAIYQLRRCGNSSISSRRAKPGSYTEARTTPEQCYFEKILLGLLLDYLADT